MAFEINYDEWIHLDSEELAEAGIARAYESLLPRLQNYVESPDSIEEFLDDDIPCYSVKCGGKEFAIYGPELDEQNGDNSWVRATYAFFTIVNDQLQNASHRFYAINGGHDLGGMFLTPCEADEAQISLSDSDWPYIPEDEAPWNGMPN